MDVKNSTALHAKSKSLSLPSSTVNVNIGAMKGIIHNSNEIYFEEFSEKQKYSSLVSIPELIVNVGLQWSINKNKDDDKIEDHWAHQIAVP